MASRSSSDHPESSHPYHTDRSQSTTSLESQGQKRSGLLSHLLPSSWKKGLLPLPEGTSLSSSSPPPSLPRIPHMPLDLPHPASTPITEITAGDLMWAATYESPPLPPMTILGMPILQHPQPQSAQASSGIILPSPLSAYIPAPRDGSPNHRTPPPVTNTLQHRGAPPIWDQPTSVLQHPFELVPDKEPIASSSTLPEPNDSSYWLNVIEQREIHRPWLHRRRWARIDRQLRSEPQPPPELLAPPELRHYEYITDETSGEGTLYEFTRPATPFHRTTPLPNGIPESESSPEPSSSTIVSRTPPGNGSARGPLYFTRKQPRISASQSQKS